MDSKDLHGEAPGVFPSIADAFNALTLFAGIPALTVLPVGMIGIWMQQLTKGHDFVDAWYIVSLIPKMVTIGFGIQVVIFSIIPSVVLSLVAVLTLYLFFASGICSLKRMFNRKKHDFWGVDQKEHLAALKRLAVLGFCLVGFAFAVIVPILGHTTFNGAILACPIVGGIAGGAVLARDHHQKLRLEQDHPGVRIDIRRWALRGVAVAYLGAIVSALMAIGWYPESYAFGDLPEVILHESQAEGLCPEPESETEPCTLLAHADGYWHLVNGEDGTVMSVPESKVDDVVQIRPEDRQ